MLKRAVQTEVRQMVIESVAAMREQLDHLSQAPSAPSIPTVTPRDMRLAEIESQRTQQLSDAESRAASEASRLAANRDQAIQDAASLAEAAIGRAQAAVQQESLNATTTMSANLVAAERARDEALRQAAQTHEQRRENALAPDENSKRNGAVNHSG